MKDNKLWMWIGITFVLTIMFAVLANSVEAKLSDNLMSYYNFEEASGVLIDNNRVKNLSLVGSSNSYVFTGKINNSRYLSNKSTYFYTVNNYPTPFYSSSNYSVSLWAFRNSTETEDGLLFRWNPAINNVRFQNYLCGNTNSLRTLFYQPGGGSTPPSFNCSFMPQGYWTHLVMVMDVTNFTQSLYVNNTLISVSELQTSSAVEFGVLYLGSQYSSSYSLDETAVWNKSLSPTEISLLWNSGNGLSYTDVMNHDTYYEVTAKDFYNGATLFNLSVNISTYNGTSYSNSNTTGSVLIYNLSASAFQLSPVLWNISLCSTDNGGYFCSQHLNVNISNSSFTSHPFQAIVNLNATELVTGVVLSGTKSTTNYTNNSGTFYLKAGTYTFTFTAPGYYPAEKTVIVTALTNTNQVITGVYNATVNMTFRDNITNASILNANFSVSNTTYGYYANYSTSNGSVLIPAIYPLTYFYNASAYGFSNVTSATLNVTSNATNKTVYLLGQGLILINIINANTGNLILYQNTTMLVQNSTTQLSFNIVNGSGNISGLVEGSTYTFNFNSTGFDNTPYFITYTSTLANTLFLAYLPQSTTVFDFNIKTRNGQSIENALVTIERFVNGSYIVAGSQTTNVVGSASFNIQSGLIHRITVSKDGFLTQSFTDYLTATPPYEIVLFETVSFTFDSDPAGITTSYRPTNTNLSPVTTLFEFNTSTLGTLRLDDFSISIWDNNNNLLAYNSSTDVHGGTVSVSLSLLPYNQSWILVSYDYKRDGFSTAHQFRKYYVANQDYVGTIANMRDWIATAMTVEQRIWLWLLTVVATVLMVRTFFQNGEAVLGIGSLASVGLAYAYAFPPVTFTFVGITSFIVILFLWERG